MSRGSNLAKRVVKVLLNRLAGKTEEQIKFLELLKTLDELYKKNKAFKDIVLNEQLSLSEKAAIVKEFVERLDIEDKGLAEELLLFLIKHHAFKYLSLIIRAYQYELENVLGTAKAEVISASELPEELKKKLVETLEGKLNKKLEVEFKTDPELIGGFVVKTTSFVVDASVKDLLRELALKI
ncbi:MAG TPA: ATP synthase F1 subunit delta [Aquificales bacterium]|nr:ATP synthase F1 subunit delta [Aquificales bacterium]